MPNHLINETSPYLLQHAHNPVDWYPWGEEALRRAREEDRPILLSIGYSACHWCHVMERESFEDPDTAALMNELFVCIKVDREERPDLDSIYMQAVQAMTGRGGWPLTVFLTPDRVPFFGGTYFPPEDRHGMAGFPRVLRAMSDAYRERRAEVAKAAEQLLNVIQGTTRRRSSGTELLTPTLLDEAYQAAQQAFEPAFGGFGSAPKFPTPMLQELLLRHHHRTGEPEALRMVEETLGAMAKGGIHDHLGGGFHRYSTDAQWLVPHFEKMLYDNALLSRLYLHAYQVTGRELYRRVTEETLDYILREMADPAGGFYSTQDADSEGVEGKFYLWRPAEVREALGPEEGDLLCRYYDVSLEGNFEGNNILHVTRDLNDLATELGKPLKAAEESLAHGRQRLLELRQKRVQPDKDAKVLTAWNGMALRSLAEAAAVLQRDDYLEAATHNASFLLEHLRQEGRLLRTWKDGQAKLNGYLEDYALLTDGLVALYEATFDTRWLHGARALGDAMLELFWDAGQGALYDTGNDHEELLVRPREVVDGATPSGSAVAAETLLRLALLTGDERYRQVAATALRSMGEMLANHPTALAHWLCALDLYLSTPKEVAIVGPREDSSTQALLRVVFQRFQPNRVVAGYEPDGAPPDGVPLLEDREMVGGRPTAYVCQNYACQMPVNDPEALAAQLDAAQSLGFRAI